MSSVSSKKLNVFLDLDNTLLSANPLEDFPFDKISEQKVEKFPNNHNMDDYYLIFERPGLQEFLDYLFANFNVSVWSAASQSYVLYIVDNIILLPNKPERKLDYVLFSYHCNLSKKITKGGLKSLCMLWEEFDELFPGYNKNNTIIIDDLDKVKKIQTENCYNIKAFEFLEDGSENDKELQKVQLFLEKWKRSHS